MGENKKMKIAKRKYFLKEASVLLITAILFLSSIVVIADTEEYTKYLDQDISVDGGQESDLKTRDVLFEDGFESYTDFAVDNFPPWTTHDFDQGQTWGIQDVTFPNQGYVGSFIVFNPYETTPPIDGNHPPHTGQKYLACFDATTAYAPNDDWLISPQISADTFDELSFWARSLTSQYGLERMRVLVSTTDNQPGSFSPITTEPYVQVPVDWTEYTFDLSSYSGDIYIAINCVSNDAFALFIDDFQVTGSTGGSEDCYVQVVNTTAESGDIGHEIPIMGGWDQPIRGMIVAVKYNASIGWPTGVSFEGSVIEDYNPTFSTDSNGLVYLFFTNPDYIGPDEGLLGTININIYGSTPDDIYPIGIFNLEGYPSGFYQDTNWAIPIPTNQINGTLTVGSNTAPNTPGTPTGPSTGYVGEDYEFSGSTTDPDEDDVYYMFDWGNGEFSDWLGPYASGEEVTATYSWDSTGKFNVKLKAKDIYDEESGWSTAKSINIKQNQPPEIPETPSGETEGEPEVDYTFTTNTTDPDEDDVYYMFDWGNGEFSDWLGPYASGEEIQVSYNWSAEGTYDIKVKAKDALDQETDYSDAHTIEIAEVPDPEPVLSIKSIEGGTGITAVIENTGDADATDVEWTITIEGGFFILTKEATDVIESIEAGDEAEITMSVFGIGLGILTDMPIITVSAECAEGSSDDDSVEAQIILSKVTIQE